MLDKASHTMVMTEEQRRKYHAQIVEVGPFQIGEKADERTVGDFIHVLLPTVKTIEERTHHLSLLGNIERSIQKDGLQKKNQEQQQRDREIRQNIKKFGVVGKLRLK